MVKKGDKEIWHLKLFVAGKTDIKSIAVFAVLNRICRELLPGKCRIDLIDVKKDSKAAFEEGIFALPAVVRILPLPVRKLIGGMSNEEKAIAWLEL